MAVLKPKEMAERLGVTVRTLQEWDRKGIFPAHRTPTNKRYYTEQDYLKYINNNSDPKKDKRKVVGYARVSTANQKDDYNVLAIANDDFKSWHNTYLFCLKSDKPVILLDQSRNGNPIVVKVVKDTSLNKIFSQLVK